LPKFLSGNRPDTSLSPTLDSGRPKINSLSVPKTGRPKASLLPALNHASAPALLQKKGQPLGSKNKLKLSTIFFA